MRVLCSREIFTKKCRQQQIFDSDLKGAWHYNHVTFTPIAKYFMLYCRLIYMLSILCVRLTIKVRVGIPGSFKVGWYPPKKLGRVTLRLKRIIAAVTGTCIFGDAATSIEDCSVLFGDIFIVPFLGSALRLTAMCSLGWGDLVAFDWNDLPVGREFDRKFLKKVKSPPYALPPPPPALH